MQNKILLTSILKNLVRSIFNQKGAKFSHSITSLNKHRGKVPKTVSENIPTSELPKELIDDYRVSLDTKEGKDGDKSYTNQKLRGEEPHVTM